MSIMSVKELCEKLLEEFGMLLVGQGLAVL
jgi:hypothetical protein